MIVDPDFVDHWKTRTLVALLDDDEAAPLYVIRLWAHCQNRRTWYFDLPAAALKAICRYTGDAAKFEQAMIDCGFVSRLDGQITVVGWEEYNASLIAAWANGNKGGRPRKAKAEDNEETHGLPMANPPETHGVTDKRGLDKSREEEPKSKAVARGSRLPKDWVPSDDDLDFIRKERPELDASSIAGQFRDYWIAKAGKDGVKTDWPATWRNWVRNQRVKYSGGGGGGLNYHDDRKRFMDELTGRTRNAAIDDANIIDI